MQNDRFIIPIWIGSECEWIATQPRGEAQESHNQIYRASSHNTHVGIHCSKKDAEVEGGIRWEDIKRTEGTEEICTNIRGKTENVFAYMLDTDIKGFLEAKVSAHVILIECTYIRALQENALELAAKNGHIAWEQLVSAIEESHSDTNWILSHFSMRYTDDEIVAFFKKIKSKRALYVWLDSGVYCVEQEKD